MPKLTKRQQEAADRRKAAILNHAESGVTQAEIAKRCRCSQQYVSKIIRTHNGQAKR